MRFKVLIHQTQYPQHWQLRGWKRRQLLPSLGDVYADLAENYKLPQHSAYSPQLVSIVCWL